MGLAEHEGNPGESGPAVPKPVPQPCRVVVTHSLEPDCTVQPVVNPHARLTPSETGACQGSAIVRRNAIQGKCRGPTYITNAPRPRPEVRGRCESCAGYPARPARF